MYSKEESLEREEVVDPVERAQVLSDSAPLSVPNPSCSGCGVAAWWRMVNYIKFERNIAPWTVAVTEIMRVGMVIQNKKDDTERIYVHFNSHEAVDYIDSRMSK